jgi:hypothetical protein
MGSFGAKSAQDPASATAAPTPEDRLQSAAVLEDIRGNLMKIN